MDVGTTAAWATAGISPERLRTLTRRGELVRLRRGVYATSGAMAATVGDKARRPAREVRGVLALTHATLAAQESAALAHGLPLLHEPATGTVSLTRPAGQYRGATAAGVRYHVAQVRREHVTTVHGALVTTAGRTTI